MIASVDGGTAIGGRSGGLGGPGDKAVFRALRATADVVLVGAGTARDENYGAIALDETTRSQRRASGRAAVPRLALVSGRLDLDPASPMFASAAEPPLVFTVRTALDQATPELTAVAELVEAGEGRVDLSVVVDELHRRGAGVVLVEGGPSINGQLVAAGLIDEWCLSVAPMLVAGDSARVAHGPGPDTPQRLALHRVLEEDGYLFVTYRRAR